MSPGIKSFSEALVTDANALGMNQTVNFRAGNQNNELTEAGS